MKFKYGMKVMIKRKGFYENAVGIVIEETGPSFRVKLAHGHDLVVQEEDLYPIPPLEQLQPVKLKR